jgi:hypothetical protein
MNRRANLGSRQEDSVMTPLMHRFARPLLALAFVFAACKTPEVALRPMERTPASEGSIALSKDKNGNTVGEVKMKHLPPPAMLSPELATYVVWAKPAGQSSYSNVGQVRMDADRAASTFIQLPYNAFEVLITAEPTGSVQEPSQYKVLEGSVGAPPVRGPESESEQQLTPATPKPTPSPQSTPREENEPQTTPDT